MSKQSTSCRQRFGVWVEAAGKRGSKVILQNALENRTGAIETITFEHGHGQVLLNEAAGMVGVKFECRMDRIHRADFQPASSQRPGFTRRASSGGGGNRLNVVRVNGRLLTHSDGKAVERSTRFPALPPLHTKVCTQGSCVPGNCRVASRGQTSIAKVARNT